MELCDLVELVEDGVLWRLGSLRNALQGVLVLRLILFEPATFLRNYFQPIDLPAYDESHNITHTLFFLRLPALVQMVLPNTKQQWSYMA